MNRAIGESGLAPLTWGNASAVDRNFGVMAIKPSGVPYASLSPDQIVVLDMDGTIREGNLTPSSDSVTHLVLYRELPNIGGIVHTHSKAATIWAQACLALPCLGTTHADHFHGPVPITRDLSDDEVAGDYVGNTARLILETVQDTAGVPAVLVARHGPFTWGETVEDALDNAIALERIAEMALSTLALNGELTPMSATLLAKHHRRKHGPDASYGQRD